MGTSSVGSAQRGHVTLCLKDCTNLAFQDLIYTLPARAGGHSGLEDGQGARLSLVVVPGGIGASLLGSGALFAARGAVDFSRGDRGKPARFGRRPVAGPGLPLCLAGAAAALLPDALNVMRSLEPCR